MARRILFVSFACYLDDANGAAVATRAMLEHLARREFAVEALCGPLLEPGREIEVPSMLAARGLPIVAGRSTSRAVKGLGGAGTGPDFWRVVLHGVPVTILAGPSRPRMPGDAERAAFLELFEEAWERFRPEVVVSYGGGWLTGEVLGRARSRGAATVFPLHNLRYRDPASFQHADVVLVASRFAAEHYRRTLGLRCVVLSYLVDFERARVSEGERRPTFVVFVNPTIEKGTAVFARIADELGRRRPDVPFLVVEGKGTEADVAAWGLDLRDRGNVYFHEHTHDPRRFWRIAKLCLLPSLVAENQPLVAIEAMINGVPVIGSDRGGIPEALGDAGTILPLPDRLTPSTPSLPTSEEIAPWIGAILELWDSPGLAEERGRHARAEARRWLPDAVGPRYEALFNAVGRRRGD